MFDNEPGGENCPKVKICANCRNNWREGDKYCRYCGAPLDQPGYKIREFYTIYGPMPVRRRHTCTACGHTWENTLMVDDEKYCPRCGSEVSVEQVDEDEKRDRWSRIRDL